MNKRLVFQVLSVGLSLFSFVHTAVAGDWTPNGNDIYYDAGNVGIGTATPDAAVEIERNQADYSTGLILRINNSNQLNWDLGKISTGIEFAKEGTVNGYIRSVHTRPGGMHSFNDAGLIFGTASSNNSAVDRMVLTHAGNLGIGTATPPEKLTVNGNASINGTVLAKEVKVQTDVPWADYVLVPDYQLPSLHEVASYIEENKHLPDIPSAAQVEKDGLNMAEMMAKQMRKIEELTLYLIEMRKENDELKDRLTVLEKKW